VQDKLTRGRLPQDFSEGAIGISDDGVREIASCAGPSSTQDFCAESVCRAIIPAKAGIQFSF
jgi:hypothetical protein